MENVGDTNGNRIFNLVTMNVDTLQTIGAVDSLITTLQTSNIDVVRISATHNDRNGHVGRRKYEILFSGGDTECAKH